MIGKTPSEELLIKPTKIFPTRNKVDTINNNEMNKLTTSEDFVYEIKYVYDLPSSDKGRENKEKETKFHFTPEQIRAEMDYIQNNLMCEKTLRLKIGCQVMCIVNIELSNGAILCNGSQGIVTGISEQRIPIVKFNHGVEVQMGYHTWTSENIPKIGILQIPLILSWALTIHKSQGSTLDAAEIDVGNEVFECGQTYVALSRVKSLEGLYLSSFDVNKIRIHKKVREFYDGLKKN